MVVLVRACEAGRDREGPLPPCGSGLDREERRHGFRYVSAALSLAFSSGFALLGDSLFSVAKKVSKNACPRIRPVASLRVRSLRRRSEGRRTRALHGPLRLSRHPCRSPLSTTAPLTLLKGRLVPPARSCKKHHAGTTAGDLQTALPPCLAGDVGWKTAQHFPPQASSKFLPGQRGLICKPVDRLRVTHATDPFRNFQSARTPAPVRRPSVGAAQGDARHGRRARSEGTGTSLRDGPRSSAGGREVLRSKTRMSGSPSLWLLSLGETRESDAPCKAQPVVRAEESAARPNRPPKPTTVMSSTSLTSDATARRTNQASGSPRRPHTMSLSPCA
ncbi:hypothetical protein PSNTI_08650 [Stutzerimonas stutzeri]|nr:hypothetical protein PSNTI_08650 [Stutzerimonas stutzeri]